MGTVGHPTPSECYRHRFKKRSVNRDNFKTSTLTVFPLNLQTCAIFLVYLDRFEVLLETNNSKVNLKDLFCDYTTESEKKYRKAQKILSNIYW